MKACVKKNFLPLTLLFLTVGVLIACTGSSRRESEEPLQTIDYVNLERYEGTWYEIARFPFFAQEGCINTTATYEKNPDGTVRVTNRCFKDGEESIAKATARVVDEESQAKLKVRFESFPANLFEGDYWIIELGDDYDYAVVSEPAGRYLWILDRDPQMAEDLLQSIKARLAKDGFRMEDLLMTPQN